MKKSKLFDLIGNSIKSALLKTEAITIGGVPAQTNQNKIVATVDPSGKISVGKELNSTDLARNPKLASAIQQTSNQMAQQQVNTNNIQTSANPSNNNQQAKSAPSQPAQQQQQQGQSQPIPANATQQTVPMTPGGQPVVPASQQDKVTESKKPFMKKIIKENKPNCDQVIYTLASEKNKIKHLATWPDNDMPNNDQDIKTEISFGHDHKHNDIKIVKKSCVNKKKTIKENSDNQQFEKKSPDVIKKHDKWIVVDNEFNRYWYKNIIGKIYDTPPAYAIVRKIKEYKTMTEAINNQFQVGKSYKAKKSLKNVLLPQQLPMLKTMLKHSGNNTLWIQSIDGNYANVAGWQGDAVLGTLRVPLSELISEAKQVGSQNRESKEKKIHRCRSCKSKLCSNCHKCHNSRCMSECGRGTNCPRQPTGIFEAKQAGSQNRESMKEAGYTFVKKLSYGDIVLKNKDGKLEVWNQNDDFAGYVIVYKGKGYEFIRDYKDKSNSIAENKKEKSPKVVLKENFFLTLYDNNKSVLYEEELGYFDIVAIASNLTNVYSTACRSFIQNLRFGIISAKICQVLKEAGHLEGISIEEFRYELTKAMLENADKAFDGVAKGNLVHIYGTVTIDGDPDIKVHMKMIYSINGGLRDMNVEVEGTKSQKGSKKQKETFRRSETKEKNIPFESMEAFQQSAKEQFLTPFDDTEDGNNLSIALAIEQGLKDAFAPINEFPVPEKIKKKDMEQDDTTA